MEDALTGHASLLRRRCSIVSHQLPPASMAAKLCSGADLKSWKVRASFVSRAALNQPLKRVAESVFQLSTPSVGNPEA